MPWIDEEMCVGCAICVDECYPGAISMQGHLASLDEGACIRCGVCHDACPEEAIRHDGERIPEEVEANLTWARTLLAHEYYSDRVEQRGALMERLGRYFTKEKRVAERTIERLGDLLEPTENQQ